jgi:hypothetical protein
MAPKGQSGAETSGLRTRLFATFYNHPSPSSDWPANCLDQIRQDELKDAFRRRPDAMERHLQLVHRVVAG